MIRHYFSINHLHFNSYCSHHYCIFILVKPQASGGTVWFLASLPRFVDKMKVFNCVPNIMRNIQILKLETIFWVIE